MKRIIALLLLFALALSISACSPAEPKEVSCEEIIEAYEAAGYVVDYHNHEDPLYYPYGESCHIKINDPYEPDRNYIYLTRYFEAEDAKEVAKERAFNPLIWLFTGIYGEWRWLENGSYGVIYYETFSDKMILPLREIMK